eukprot:1154560-Pelagomonas_calceolata.AAC.11
MADAHTKAAPAGHSPHAHLSILTAGDHHTLLVPSCYMQAQGDRCGCEEQGVVTGGNARSRV